MANTIVNTVEYPKKIQKNLRTGLVADRIASAMFGNVGPKQQIVFPYRNMPRRQDYTYSGSNTVDDSTMVTDGYTIDQVKTATGNYDPIQNNLMQDPSWQDDMADDMGFVLAEGIDQYALQTGIDNAYATVAGGTVDASNMMALLATTDARLTENRAMSGSRYIVMDPLRVAVLPQMDASNGYMAADRALEVGMNGYVGRTSVGLEVFVSNNLPYSLTLTMASQPSNTETLVFKGVTFTFVSSLGSTAGNVLIGAGATDTQANLVAAINGAAGAGSTYVDLSDDDRNLLRNAEVAVTAFAANVATLTAYGRMDATSTAANLVVGTETFSMLTGVMGAIDLTILEQPRVEELSVSSVGSANHSKNLIATTLYGGGVFKRRKRGLIEITANA